MIYNKPFFSIIITILNGEATIKDCIESITDQTFTDYELVLVDGGSTDSTVNIIKSCNIRNVKLEISNGAGLYEGLNIGTEISSGSWLYFMGCDDKIHANNTLELISEVIKSEEKKVKVFVGNVNCIKQKNVLKARFGSPYWMHYQVHHQGVFYEKSLFDSLSYNENMRIASDYELNLMLAINKIPHRYINIITCDFGGDGISENQMKNVAAEMQLVHRRVFKGIPLLVALLSFNVQHNIVLLRKRLGLTNLKVRFKEFINTIH